SPGRRRREVLTQPVLAKLLPRVWMMDSARFADLMLLAARAAEGVEISPEAIAACIGSTAFAPLDHAQVSATVRYVTPGSNEKLFAQVGATAVIDVWGVLDRTDDDVRWGNWWWGT